MIDCASNLCGSLDAQAKLSVYGLIPRNEASQLWTAVIELWRRPTSVIRREHGCFFLPLPIKCSTILKFSTCLFWKLFVFIIATVSFRNCLFITAWWLTILFCFAFFCWCFSSVLVLCFCSQESTVVTGCWGFNLQNREAWSCQVPLCGNRHLHC